MERILPALLQQTIMDSRYIVDLSELSARDTNRVGGKNASLGEMIRNVQSVGVNVPPGFATTAEAYWDFLDANGLRAGIESALGDRPTGAALSRASKTIRRLFAQAQFPPELATAIVDAYRDLSAKLQRDQVHVAVRSSATAEDLPSASFAGQQETFLNVTGEEALLEACRDCFASLFADRAIAYREAHGFEHLKVALSIGVQQTVRSDKAGAGVLFTIDTETGFPNTLLINAAWGLGENVVRGTIEPDQYVVFKPLLDRSELCPIVEKTIGQKQHKLVYANRSATRNVATTRAERRAFVLSDSEILTLARWGSAIEAHYGRPMDLEWARDGETGSLHIVQARPETVHSREAASVLHTYKLDQTGRQLLSGQSVGGSVATGQVRILRSPSEGGTFEDGAILVTEMTDPDWVPVMKRAAAIVTNHGGRTSHAAIVSREMGLPAVVGTGSATEVLRNRQAVTVSCAEGDEGHVYEGIAQVEKQEVHPEQLPKTRTQVMLILANPAEALRWWRLPADGVGLTRIEFIIGNLIKVHPLALTHWDQVRDRAVRKQINELTAGYADRTEYFVEQLAHGIARIAAAWYPRPVIVRTSDFKSNEYANLIGGAQFEPDEENPMLGFRGATRYASEQYRAAFALECRALQRVRNDIGLTNVVVMIPFCRTPAEADQVLDVLAENGLVRGVHGLQVYVMCEVPSNVTLAEAFASRFDGFSIGSNDLTQLVLGVDRDSAMLAPLFDERDEAVMTLIREVIKRAHRQGTNVGLCGQAPSDYPEFARFLVEAGIDSLSVTPDSFVSVKEQVAAAESTLAHAA